MTQILRITIDIGLDAARVTFGGNARVARYGAYLLAAHAELAGLYAEVESGDNAASATLGPDPVEPDPRAAQQMRLVVGQVLFAVEHEAARRGIRVTSSYGAESAPDTLRVS